MPCEDTIVANPRPGQSIETAPLTDTAPGWPDVAWQSAAVDPINATEAGDEDARMDVDALFERSAPHPPVN